MAARRPIKQHPVVRDALVELCLAHVKKAPRATIAELRKRWAEAKKQYGVRKK